MSHNTAVRMRGGNHWGMGLVSFQKNVNTLKTGHVQLVLSYYRFIKCLNVFHPSSSSLHISELAYYS